MARKTYETEEDKKRELAIAVRFSTKFNAKAIKTPDKYAVDFVIQRNRSTVALLEAKRRTVSIKKYPDIIPSLHKAANGRAYSKITGLPFIFVVQFDDAIAWTDLSEGEYETRYEGRTDRNDGQDEEPCICIPIGQFKRII